MTRRLLALSVPLMALWHRFADRIADRLAIALEPRLERLEAEIRGKVLRAGKRAAAGILARKSLETALEEPQASLLDPPETVASNGDGYAWRRKPWDSR